RGDQAGRVSLVFVRRRLEVCKANDEEASAGRVVRGLEQAAEDRIPVEAGETAPDDSSPSIDQRRYRAVPDNGKVQVVHERAPLLIFWRFPTRGHSDEGMQPGEPAQSNSWPLVSLGPDCSPALLPKHF